MQSNWDARSGSVDDTVEVYTGLPSLLRSLRLGEPSLLHQQLLLLRGAAEIAKHRQQQVAVLQDAHVDTVHLSFMGYGKKRTQSCLTN